MTTSLPGQEIQAFFLHGQKVRRIAPINSDAPALPETLVIPPGDYQIFGQKYSLREEGLYRFIHANVENRHCIVFREDVWALMSAVCWLVSHGYRDDGKAFEEKSEIARYGKLVITCGDCSKFTWELFQLLNIPIRQVDIRTLLESNGYNDGHTLTEVMFEGHWIVYDPDKGMLYSKDNRRLDIVELVRLAQNSIYQREYLSAHIPVAIGHFTADDYAYDLWLETCLSNEQLYCEMMNRLMGVPVILDDGTNYYTALSESDRQAIEELHSDWQLQYLPLNEFRARFYAN